MLRIIRVGIDYGIVVAMEPATARIGDKRAKYYRYVGQTFANGKPGKFWKVHRANALVYFGPFGGVIGHDGQKSLGKRFSSLEELTEYINARRMEARPIHTLPFFADNEDSEEVQELGLV